MTPWPKRIRTRAGNLKHGDRLIAIADEPDILIEMRRTIVSGQKPVVALSRRMVEEFGNEARDHPLRQLAGEIAAYLVETHLGAVRSSGSRTIIADPVFTSGTPFRLPDGPGLSPPSEPIATELLIRHLTDDALEAVSAMINVERRRRIAA